MEALGIDVGGSGVKAAPVDLDTGKRLAKRLRIRTPQPSTPEAVYEVITKLVQAFDWHGPIGCAVPAVVRGGVVYTAANIDDSWIGTDAAGDLSRLFDIRVRVLNDADAAGIAENVFGAARGLGGVVILLTLGTGIGSAIFSDGELVPNTELGHLEFKGGDAEDYAAARLVDSGLDQAAWAMRLNEYLQHLETVLAPDYFVLGGGISKNFDQYSAAFDTRAAVIPARFRNRAGIIGAALATKGPT
ncbi:MAG: ROK family protein [Acidimicrobiia bacterium]|nr:ROK family protein [Acidimicrobiia bacterium]